MEECDDQKHDENTDKDRFQSIHNRSRGGKGRGQVAAPGA